MRYVMMVNWEKGSMGIVMEAESRVAAIKAAAERAAERSPSLPLCAVSIYSEEGVVKGWDGKPRGEDDDV